MKIKIGNERTIVVATIEDARRWCELHQSTNPFRNNHLATFANESHLIDIRTVHTI